MKMHKGYKEILLFKEKAVCKVNLFPNSFIQNPIFNEQCIQVFMVMQVGIVGWMDGLRLYNLFNSISVISGPWADDKERLCAMEPSLRLRRFRLEQGLRTASSVGQHLTNHATASPKGMVGL